jgi:hypothetical protein
MNLTVEIEQEEDGRWIAADFLAQLVTLAPEEIVYADEAGMDSRDQYDYGYSEGGGLRGMVLASLFS